MHTLDLIAIAESRPQSLRQTAIEAGLEPNALALGKHTGHLSPGAAALLAAYLGENAAAWAIAAAAEATKKPRMAVALAKLAEDWRKRSIKNQRGTGHGEGLRATAGESGRSIRKTIRLMLDRWTPYRRAASDIEQRDSRTSE